MADDSNVSSCEKTFFNLPHQDIVFDKIFSYLGLDEIFKCRRLSKDFKNLCEEYFKTSPKIDINRVLQPSKMTSRIIEQITLENSSLNCLILRNPRYLLEDCVLVNIFSRNPGLQTLDLTGCRMLTSVVILKLAEFCPLLREMILRGCLWVSPQSLTKVFQSCPCLERVDLTHCSRTHEDCIKILAQNAPKLKFITLNYCTRMTDQCIATLASCCPYLTHVGVSGCIYLTDSCLKTLAAKCPVLCSVEVDGCNSMTKDGIYFLWDKGIKTDVEREFVEKSKFWS